MMRRASLAVLMALGMTSGRAHASDRAHAPTLSDTLLARWQGAWVVTTTETFSDCAGSYTDNWVGGDMVSSRGLNRFAAGTPARVDSVDVRDDRIALRLTLSEMLLVTRLSESGRVLHDEARCQVEIKVGLPDGLYETADLFAVESLVHPAAERYRNEDQAILAANFLPRDLDNYFALRDMAIAGHREWKGGQERAALETRMAQWVSETSRLSRQINSDPDYLAGFARGVENGRSQAVTQCADLMKVQPAMRPYRGAASTAVAASKGKRQKSWSRGYEDGQTMAQGLEAIRVLPECAASPENVGAVGVHAPWAPQGRNAMAPTAISPGGR